MGADLELQCSCGRFKAHLKDAGPTIGSHCECHCQDCQCFARHLGRQDLLGPRGETSIFQTSIWRLSIDTGQEHLRSLRLSPKGLVRWYVDCCKTPVGNTVATGRLNFLGLLMLPQDPEKTNQLGAVIGRANTGSATGNGAKLRDFGILRLVSRLLIRALKARLRRGVTAQPFFSVDGQPTRTPQILTLEERNAARQV